MMALGCQGNISLILERLPLFFVDPSPCFYDFLWTYMPVLPYILIKQSQLHGSQQKNIVCLYVVNDMMSYCEVS